MRKSIIFVHSWTALGKLDEKKLLLISLVKTLCCAGIYGYKWEHIT